MTSIIILSIFILILVAINIGLFFMLKKNAEAPKDDIGLKLILEQVNELSRTVDSKVSDLNKTVDLKMGESTRHMSDSVNRQFSESQKLIREITNELAQVKETGKQVVGFADQLQNLQDILKNPKQRGIIGEYYLETLLKNVLPPGMFQMQYAFSDGEIVDAAVFVKDKIIPIDSKFSLENYNKLVEERNETEKARLEKLFVSDLKKRIEETSKYIRPQEGTMDFAFMFIPHEAIYYDLIVNKIGALKEETENLIQRAAQKYKVIIVSPTSFLAYLQTVMQGLKALQIEETAKDIIKRVEELGKHLKAYEEYHGKLGNALGTTVNHFNKASGELKKVDKDVMRITGETPGIDIELIDKPDDGE
jgi:DNA recombination protein RmuC